MPIDGAANTITDIAIANMPTPIANPLDVFELFLDVDPCMTLAIPANNRPNDNKMATKPVAYNGKARTVAPNPTTKAPRMTLPTLEDFE